VLHASILNLLHQLPQCPCCLARPADFEQDASGALLALALGSALLQHLGHAAPWLAKEVVWLLPDASCGLVQALQAWADAYQRPVSNFSTSRGSRRCSRMCSRMLDGRMMALAAVRGGISCSIRCDASASRHSSAVLALFRIVRKLRFCKFNLLTHLPLACCYAAAHQVLLPCAAPASSGLEHFGRAGVLQQGLLLELPSGRGNRLQVSLEGHEGLLPKLDLFWLIRWGWGAAVPASARQHAPRCFTFHVASGCSGSLSGRLGSSWIVGLASESCLHQAACTVLPLMSCVSPTCA
jgi:hypothetical protein